MEMDMVVDMKVDKVADIVADMVVDNKKITINIDNNMEIQFGERVGLLIGLKLFRSEAYTACASSKLCEFITVNMCFSKN